MDYYYYYFKLARFQIVFQSENIDWLFFFQLFLEVFECILQIS